MKITLALITMNEIHGSRATYDAVPWSAVDEAIVVDGNSTDGTAEFYQDKGLPVHRQVERGLGAAMMLARAKAKGDAVIFFHPDGNEDPQDIPRFRPLLEEGFDMVVASRMMAGAYNEEDDNLIRPRKWANLGFALIANTLWRRSGPYVTEMVNGFRAVTCDAWDRMQLTSRDCTMDYQMIIRAFKAGMRIGEFPTREGHRVSGGTKFKSIPTGMAELRLLRDEIIGGQRVFKKQPESLDRSSRVERVEVS